MDNKGHIITSLDKMLVNVPILVTKATVIRETLRMAGDRNIDKIEMKVIRNFFVINSIRGLIKIPSKILIMLLALRI